MLVHIVVCLAVLLVPHLALADDAPAAAPGRCASSKTSDGIRQCFPDRGTGVFTIRVAKGATVLIRTEEKLERHQPPESRYFYVNQPEDHTLMIRPKVDSWPATTSAWVKTKTMSLTLKFELVSPREADAQVHFVSWERRNQDAEVERRWRAREKVLQAQYNKKLATVRKQARRLSRVETVAQLVSGGAQLRRVRGERRVYQSHITVRAHERLRVAHERYVRITIKNEDSDVLQFGLPSAWLERAGQAVTLPGKTVKCQVLQLRPEQQTTCWIGLGRRKRLGADERLTVEVRELRGSRRARLRGVDVR